MKKIVLKTGGCTLTITKAIFQYDNIGGSKATDVDVAVRFDFEYNDGTKEHNSMGMKRAAALAMFMGVSYVEWIKFVANETEVIPVED